MAKPPDGGGHSGIDRRPSAEEIERGKRFQANKNADQLARDKRAQDTGKATAERLRSEGK